MAKIEDADGPKPAPRQEARLHEWVHFRLGRTCARCGLTLTKDEADASTECGASAPRKTPRKTSAKGG